MDIQRELKELYNSIQSRKTTVKKIQTIGFYVPYKLVEQKLYPNLYEWINRKTLKGILESGFRILWTDRNQADSNNRPANKYFPHIDKIRANEYPSGSLNIPIENCDHHTITSWHKINPMQKNIKKFETFESLSDESKETIFESVCMKMNDVFLIRTNIFHSVRNLGDKKRIIASWRILPNISWNTVVKKFFKNNLIEKTNKKIITDLY